MKTAISTENKIDELLGSLDIDTNHVQKTLSRLNELRSLVIKRDDVALAKMLKGLQADSDEYRSNELQRQTIRKDLAKILACDERQLTLSKLEKIVSGEKKNQLVEIKTKLRALTEELKKEVASTTLLLSDCARFNRMLLRSILGPASTATTYYSANGAANRQADTSFINLKF